jgi:hypothetical protein
MKIGFTGTRNGMTSQQKKVITRFEIFTTKVLEAHHGDCPGSDADFHYFIREIDPAMPSTQAFMLDSIISFPYTLVHWNLNFLRFYKAF